MLKVILMANWGLGVEILNVLHQHPKIDIAAVVTQFKAGSSDPWENALWYQSKRLGCLTISQDDISFFELSEMIQRLKARLLICHAYMRILPKSIISLPKYGTVNIHPSLLPKYRGPSPTHWVLKNKEDRTGLTCHYMDEWLDTGGIIYQLEISVKSKDTFASILERQKMIIEELLLESITRILDHSFRPTPQASELASYAPRPK
jgi:methionyl-tRNA formyltransferase